MKISPAAEASLRLYKSGKGLYPSVTEVLKVIEKPHLENWRRRVGREDAEKVARNAAVFGTHVHEQAQKVAWGDETDQAFAPYVEAIRAFFDKYVDEVLGTEVELVAPYVGDNPGFGGTLDLYCRLKSGDFAVVDFKTSSQLTREHGLQTAAYAYLAKKQGWAVDRRLVVRIKKDKPGEYYVREFKDHVGDVRAFLGLLIYWWWAHRNSVDKRQSS